MRIGPLTIERPQPEPNGRRDISEILTEYDVVDVDEESGFVVVAPTGNKFALSKDFVDQELDASGTSARRILGGVDYNRSFAGHLGVQVYDQMRRSDGTVRQSLRIAKTPVLGGRWFVASYEPGDPLHDEIAKFIEDALFKWQTISWFSILTESLLMLDFGYYVFEKVFTVEEEPDKVGDRRSKEMRAI